MTVYVNGSEYNAASLTSKFDSSVVSQDGLVAIVIDEYTSNSLYGDSSTETVTAVFNETGSLLYYSHSSNYSYPGSAGTPETNSRVETYNTNDQLIATSSTYNGQPEMSSSQSTTRDYGEADLLDPATFLLTTYEETSIQNEPNGETVTVAEYVEGEQYTYTSRFVDLEGNVNISGKARLAVNEGDGYLTYSENYASETDELTGTPVSYTEEAYDADSTKLWYDNGDGVRLNLDISGAIIGVSVSDRVPSSSEYMSVTKAELEQLKFVSATNETNGRSVFDAQSPVTIDDVAKTVSYIDKLDNGTQYSVDLYFNSSDELVASVAKNESSSASSQQIGMTVTYYGTDPTDPSITVIEETYSSDEMGVWTDRRVKSVDESGSFTQESREEMRDGVITIYDSMDTIESTEIYLDPDTISSVAELDNLANVYDSAVKQALSYFGTNENPVISYVDNVVVNTHDMAGGAGYGTDAGAESYTNYEGKILLLDANDKYQGALRVWASTSDSGNYDYLSLQFIAPDAQNEWDSFGDLWSQGDRTYINIREDFDQLQTLVAEDTHSSITDDLSYRQIQTNEEIIGEQSTTSVYYYGNNWNLVYAEETRGVLTTYRGKNWDVIAVEVSDSINVNALQLVTGGQFDGAYLYEEDLGDEMAANADGVSNSVSRTYLQALDGGGYELLGREEIWDQTFDDGNSDYNLTRYNADNEYVYSEWQNTWNGNTNGGSNGREFVAAADSPDYDVDVRLEYGSSTWNGGSSSYEYVYDVATGALIEGFQINDNKKTVYGADWQVVETLIVIDTSDAERLFDIGGGEFEGRAVLPSTHYEAEGVVTYAYVASEYTESYEWGSNSGRTIFYLDSNKELLYTERENTWQDNYNKLEGSSTNYSYEDSNGNWIGNRSENSDGSSYASFNYIDGSGNRVQISENSFESGWKESSEFTYDGDSWTLLSGVENKNGLVTNYASDWSKTTSIDVTKAAAYQLVESDVAGEFLLTLLGDNLSASGSDRRLELTIDSNALDGSENILRSKDIWRYGDSSGNYWSESFSIFDAQGNWLGSGSEDSEGFYSSNEDSIDGSGNRVSRGENGQKLLADDGSWDGESYLWKEGYEYTYSSNWMLVGGWQVRGGVKYTYDENWQVIETSLEVAESQLEAVVENGVVTGYVYEQPMGGYGADMYGSANQDSNTRTLFIDVDKTTIKGSKESWYWEDFDGSYWNRGETYYDANGNWQRSTYESSDGYSNSNSQVELRDESGNLTGYLSSGSTTYRDGDAYAYSYEYTSDWVFVGGYEVRDGFKWTYDSSWGLVSKEVYDETPKDEVLNDLGQLVGYESVTTKIIETEVEGATLTRTTVRSFDTTEQLQASTVTSVWSEEGYKSTTVVTKDADGQVTSRIFTDSANERLEEYYEYDESGNVLSESGVRADSLNGDLQWEYNYVNGIFDGGFEIEGGIRQVFDSEWRVSEISVEDSSLLQSTDNGGFVISSSTTDADPFGYYNFTATTDYYFDSGEVFTGLRNTTTIQYGDESIEEISVLNSELQETYVKSADTEHFYQYLVSENMEIMLDVTALNLFFDVRVDNESSFITVDGGYDNGEALTKAPLEIAARLLSSDDWSLELDTLTSNETDLGVESSLGWRDQINMNDAGAGDRVVIADLLVDYSLSEFEADTKSTDDTNANAVLGEVVVGDDTLIRINSNDGHWMVLEGNLDAPDSGSVTGIINKISLYKGETLDADPSNWSEHLLATLDNQTIRLQEDWSDYLTAGINPYDVA